ncbi:MAG: hypothetical protein HG464_001190 [Bacteroidia bacterium]|nr:hypothetical protein [Bacteroidia bacterium]
MVSAIPAKVAINSRLFACFEGAGEWRPWATGWRVGLPASRFPLFFLPSQRYNYGKQRGIGDAVSV